MLTVFAQSAIPTGARDIWDVALQFGMAGAVIVIVVVFVWYLMQRDARDERIEKTRADAVNGLGKDVQNLNVAVVRFIDKVSAK